MRAREAILRERAAEHALALAMDRERDARREKAAAAEALAAATRDTPPRFAVVMSSELSKLNSWDAREHIARAESRFLESGD